MGLGKDRAGKKRSDEKVEEKSNGGRDRKGAARVFYLKLEKEAV